MPPSPPPGGPWDYVVVGAGPAGLAAAAAISNHQSLRVGVFEMRPRPDDAFGSYPVVLNPQGMKALRRLDPVAESRTRSEGLGVKMRGVRMGTCVMRDQMAQILLDAVEPRGNVSIFWEHKLLDVDFERRVCTFDHAGVSRATVAAPRLIAADGDRSRVRRLCDEYVDGYQSEAVPWGWRMRFMNARGRPGQTAFDPSVHQVLGDVASGGRGYLCMQTNGLWNLSMSVLSDAEDFITADEPTAERVAKLRGYVRSFAPAVDDHLLDDDAYRSWYASRAFDGRIVRTPVLNPAGWIGIVGDAAHGVPPPVGQGLNAGLEDAAALADAVRGPGDPLAAFDARRRAAAHGLHRAALRIRGLLGKRTHRSRQ